MSDTKHEYQVEIRKNGRGDWTPVFPSKVTPAIAYAALECAEKLGAAGRIVRNGIVVETTKAAR